MIELDNLVHLAPRAVATSCEVDLPREHIVELADDSSYRRDLRNALLEPFEKITRLAARLFDVPAVAISLAPKNLVWYHSRIDVGTPLSFEVNKEREVTSFISRFCSARGGAGPFFCDFQDPVMLGRLSVRFCAAIPLTSENGESLGTLCLLDSRPRRAEEFALPALMDIAAITMDEIEFRVGDSLVERRLQDAKEGAMTKHRENLKKVVAAQEEKEERYQSLVGLLSDWHWEQDEDGRFTLIAEAGRLRTSMQFTQYIGKRFDDIPAANMSEKERRAFDLAIGRREPFQEVIVQWSDAGEAMRYLSISGQPVFSSEGRFKGYRGVTKDVTEKMRFQEELARSNAALRKLSEAQQAFREAERKRIARELHDELAQLLATSRMELCMLQRDLQHASPTHERLDQVDRMIGTSIVSLRKLATDLRPSSLDEGDLYYALRSLLKAFSENAGIECHLIANEADLVMDELRSTALFRLLEECLSNTAQHANAQKIVIQISRSGDAMALRIQDDGRGIRQDEMQKVNAFGLMEMRERVHKLKGKIDIEGLPGKGTRIAISLPQFFQSQ